MSIIIKSMEMPENCSMCNCNSCNFCDLTDRYIINPDQIDTACPLVEIPKSAKLIDAKELRNKVLKWMPLDPCGIEEKEYPFETDICVSMVMEIEEAPTIFEEEE